MKIGVTVSPILLSLLDNLPSEVDYIEVNGEHDLGLLQAVLAVRPALLHDISGQFWLNYTNPFTEDAMQKARAMLDLARPAWFSTGIGASAEPQGHTTSYWRGADAQAVQSRETCLDNIVRNGRRLAEMLYGDGSAGIGTLPLLLENYNYHPTGAYEYICEPQTFSRLIEQIDCGVLLDLAHAQISAFNMGWESPRSYLQALPLEKVREIHINHPYHDGGKQMLDRHQPLQAGDLDLLKWALDHAPNAEAITLESEPASPDGLLEEIELLSQAI